MKKVLRASAKVFFILLIAMMLVLTVQNVYSDYLGNRIFQKKIKPYKSLELHRVTLHYREEGTGPVLVLLHGFMGNLRQFQSIWPALSERYHVIAIDLPGFGLSEKSISMDYSKKNIAGILIDFLKSKHIESCILLGHSMGGEIAQHMVLQSPSLFTRLVLVDTGGLYRTEQRSILQYTEIPAAKYLIKNLFYTYLFQKSFARTAVYHDAAWNKEMMETTFAINRKIPIDTLMKFNKDNHFSGPFPDPTHITIPTLIIWGEKDRLIGVDAGYVYRKEMPQSSLVVFPDCGHVPFVEKPELFLKTLENFIKKKM